MMTDYVIVRSEQNKEEQEIGIDVDNIYNDETLLEEFNNGRALPSEDDKLKIVSAEGLIKNFYTPAVGIDWGNYVEVAEYLEGEGAYNEEAVLAYVSVNGDFRPDEFEENYYGKFDSDEDFARELADSVGALQEENRWPYTCIDWEQAAREIMYDFCEQHGHYFRR